MTASAAFYQGAALVDLSDRQLLKLTGEQATWFLDQLVTQKVDELPAGAGAQALLLTPNGKIKSMMRIVHGPDAVWLDAEPLSEVDLHEFFTGRVFATKVFIEEASVTHAVLALRGPRSAGAVSSFTGLGPAALPESEHDVVAFDAGLVIRVLRPVPGFDLIVARPIDSALGSLAAAEAELVSAADHSAVKSYNGVPTFGVDIDDTYLPQEAAMEYAVHFKKGCYLGQEAVAMTQRGRIKRKLRSVTFSAEGRVGEVSYGGNKVGIVSSFGKIDDARGIATIATTVEVGSEVQVGPDGLQAIVEELPFTVSGPKVPSARQLREALEQGSER